MRKIKNWLGGSNQENPLTGYAFILPQLILFAIFVFYPSILGFQLSLYEHSFVDQTFVGFDNYIELFNDPVFIKAIINTLIYVVGIVSLTIIFALFVASTVFDKNSKYVTFIRGSYYLPVMLSMVVMSIIWNFFLNPTTGLVPYLLGLVGIENVNFLGNGNTAVMVIIFVTFVGNVGQAIILYIATMIGIPADYFEAADIDGATRWQKVKNIVLPLVRPTTLYLVITNIVAVLKIFAVIQLMTGGGPNNATVSLMYLLYQQAFEYNQTGLAASTGVIMFILAVLLAIPQIKAFLNEENNN